MFCTTYIQFQLGFISTGRKLLIQSQKVRHRVNRLCQSNLKILIECHVPPPKQMNPSPADGVVSLFEVHVGSNVNLLKVGVYRAVAGEPECTFQLLQEIEFPAGSLNPGYNMVRYVFFLFRQISQVMPYIYFHISIFFMCLIHVHWDVRDLDLSHI